MYKIDNISENKKSFQLTRPVNGVDVSSEFATPCRANSVGNNVNLYNDKGALIISDDFSLWQVGVETFSNALDCARAINEAVNIVGGVTPAPTPTVNVIDNLSSTSTTDALSANQGNVLKGLIDSVKEEIPEDIATHNESSTAHTDIRTSIAANASAISALKGVGGYLTAYDFGSATPTQQQLTDYAIAQIGDIEPTEVWNGTRVKNLNDGSLWILNNTQNTDPVIFEWVNDGLDTVKQATQNTLGVVKGSEDNLKGRINSNGEIEVVGLESELNTIRLESGKIAYAGYTASQFMAAEFNRSTIIEITDNGNITIDDAFLDNVIDGVELTVFASGALTLSNSNYTVYATARSFPAVTGGKREFSIVKTTFRIDIKVSSDITKPA